MLSKLQLLFTGFAAFPAAIATGRCKCSPHDLCWPSESDWESFNSTVQGQLIRPHPIASVCYESQPDYNETACRSVLSQWTSSSFHIQDPISITYPFLANNSCPPIFPNGTSVTGDPNAGSRGCSLGTYPEFVVNATSPEMISTTLKWAKQRNIRVVIKNTGHNHLGRSTGYGSLSIWTHNLKGIEYHENFRSASCPSNSSEAQKAATIGAGEMGRDVNRALDKHGAVMVVGSNPTVGVVGWFTGGGHGPLSTTYGMGSDNLLEATVVTPNGTIITANACQNADLFYAIRGGGGGTYGVITSATMKAYPSPHTAMWRFTIGKTAASDDSQWWDAVAIFMAQQAYLKEGGMQGYYVIFGPMILGTRSLMGGFYLFNKPNGTVETLIEPLRQKLDKMSDSVTFKSSVVAGDSFMEVYEPNLQPEAVAQGSFSLGSRLLPANVLEDTDRISKTLEKLGGASEDAKSSEPAFMIGHMIANSNNRHLETALNPAWRNAVVHFLTVGSWPDGSPESVAQAARDDLTFNKTRALRELAPDSGAYFNEMDINEPNWQYAAFGENYPRLLATKNKYDPDGLLWCRHCVGSENWVEERDARLCRPSWYD